MLTQIQNYFTFETIYLWATFGILPFWLMIIFIPNLRITQILVNSIIIPLILGTTYGYLLYQTLLLDENYILESFNLYIGIDNLYVLFSNESFLLIFWLHFLALNLFLGSWVSRDGIKYNMRRGLVCVPLVLIYFAGPVGLVVYWLIRVFYAKKLGFHD